MTEDETNSAAHFSFDVVGQAAPAVARQRESGGSPAVTVRGPARSRRYAKSQRLSLAEIHALDDIEVAQVSAQKAAAAAAVEAARCEALTSAAEARTRGIFRSLLSRVCSLALVARRA